MALIQSALDRDQNFVALTAGAMPFLERKSVTFDGTTGLGAEGTTTRFTVTGDVLVGVIATCTGDLTASAGATIELGVTGSTASLLAQITSTNLDSGESWLDSTNSVAETLQTSQSRGVVIVDGNDIIETIGNSDDITGGTINYYCFWRPLSTDGLVVAA